MTAPTTPPPDDAAPAPIRVVIVDDEPLARATVRQLLEADPEIVVVGECGDAKQALATIARLQPDLLFLDIHISSAMDGFDVLAQLPPPRPHVIFVTAYDSYALRAFEVHALDYLLKPFSNSRFGEMVAHAKQRLRQGHVDELARRLMTALAALARRDEAPAADDYQRQIALRSRGHVAMVPLAQVTWIEAQDYYVQLHVNGQHHLLRQSLRDLERRLDPRQFARIHRSAIVNLDQIRELRATHAGYDEVVLRDGTCLQLSRRRRRQLREQLCQRRPS